MNAIEFLRGKGIFEPDQDFLKMKFPTITFELQELLEEYARLKVDETTDDPELNS